MLHGYGTGRLSRRGWQEECSLRRTADLIVWIGVEGQPGGITPHMAGSVGISR